MKSRKSQIFSLLVIVLGVVAWAPPLTDDLVMGSSNTTTSPNGFIGVIGNANKVNAASSMVLGENNKISHDGMSTTTPQAFRMLVVGDGNTLKNGGANTILGGYNNTASAFNSLVIGEINTVTGPMIGSMAYDSAAIGSGNQLTTTYGWAIGLNNRVLGNAGVAIGNANQANAPDSAILGTYNIIDANSNYSYALGGGLRVTQPGAVALGTWNAPMVAGDKLVVGCGDMAAPATALRITSDGGVILGRAQGDISIGAYQ